MTREEIIEALREMAQELELDYHTECILAAIDFLLEADGKKPIHEVKLNRRGGARRNKPSTAALTPDQVREARVLRVEQKKPIKELMAKYGVSRSTLRNALYGLGYYEGIL